MRKFIWNLIEILEAKIKVIVCEEMQKISLRLDEIKEFSPPAVDEEAQKRKEREILAKIPPIPNTEAAKLICRSTRQLQRKRLEWKLEWIENGNEVHYYVLPLMDAIINHRLPWNPKVFDEIRNSYNKFPRI